ncbi:MFS transporter [Clavibacter tessellarius]|uniref:MFS transporter n=1 Tax=Clavibacter tessellarius TaxID=31965 RepID=A0A225CJQ8_9MICO|nr:MFS transporter [Clavibacter michiganensis]MBT1636598.1 MFS transporter [Clavibacter michiganensis]OQJ62633.1 MFS transporter [Clavibacter michiganensis subsp. tessellarius]UKF34375.1 MFS transporter [Clavibacter michiganensis subsp. tessellarius]
MPSPSAPTTSRTSTPSREVRRARVAVAVLFFTNGAIFANLLPRYPSIKAELGLTNVEFGAAVAASPLGALIAGLAAGVLIRRYRSARVAVAATVVASVGILLAGLAPGWLVLAMALFLAGAMDAITDVAQNSHALRVQRLYGRSINNSFHAVWSVGAVAGGIMGAAAAQAGLPLIVHLSISAVVFSALAVLSLLWLLKGPEPEPGEGGAAHAHAPAPVVDAEDGVVRGASPRALGLVARYGVLLALVVIASGGAIVEDSGSTWSAIYLSRDLGASAFVAGLGFISLQGMQFVGRMLGDRMVDRFGQRAIARLGGVLVLAGMGGALAFPGVVGTIVGFGVAGFGVATLIPAAMQAADELPGFKPGTGLTIVGWLLRVGFLVSPPIVGAIADASSLRFGLIFVPAAGLLVLVFSRVLATRRPHPPAQAAPGAVASS